MTSACPRLWVPIETPRCSSTPSTPWDKGGPVSAIRLAVMDGYAPAEAARDTFSQSGYVSVRFC